jgi:hypothetical protein
MTRAPLTLAGSLGIACLAAAAIPAAAQAPPDPFAPGVRWSLAPPVAAPALPRDVAFAAGGELVWSAATLEHPRLSLCAASALSAGDAPLFQSAELAGAIGVIPVAAGGPAHLYAAPQFQDPDASHRRSEIVRYDALAAAAGAPFQPVWTRILPVQANGPALIATGPGESGGAGALVAAVHDPSAGAVHLEWIDPATGAPGVSATLPGGSLGALVAAAGGARVAFSAGLELWIVDADGSVAHHETLASATSCLALSADGSTLVAGAFGAARVLVQGAGGAFAEAAPIAGGAADIAARAAVSADGGSVAVGFWNYTNGVDVRVVWRDVGGAPGGPGGIGAVHADTTWLGVAGLQNYPQELALSPDGARLAVALWGQNGAEPELALFALGSAAPALAWSFVGSPLALAFADDGTRIALARKSSHANLFSTTGMVTVIDTGERDLQLVAPPRPGAALELAFQHPGARQAVFGVGSAASQPLAIARLTGALLLDPAQPILVFARPADGAGRADLAVPIPAGPAFVGAPLACQAIALGSAGSAFSATRVAPAVL